MDDKNKISKALTVIKILSDYEIDFNKYDIWSPINSLKQVFLYYNPKKMTFNYIDPEDLETFCYELRCAFIKLLSKSQTIDFRKYKID